MKLKNIFTLLNSVIVIIMIVLFMILSVAVNSANSELEWVIHTYDVINKSEGLLANMVDQETGMRGFLATGDVEYLEPYNKAKNSFDADIDELKLIVDDNPAQVEQLVKIEELSNRWHSEAADIYLSIKHESITSEKKIRELRDLFTIGICKEKMDTVRQQLLSEEEENLRLNVLLSMTNIENGIWDFLINMDEVYIDQDNSDYETLNNYLKEIDNQSLEKAVVDWLETVTEVKIRLVTNASNYKTEKDLYDELSKARGKSIMDQIRHEVDEFVKVEEALLVERSFKHSQQHQVSLFAIMFSIVVALAVGVLQYIITKRITDPLEKFTTQMRAFDPNHIEEIKTFNQKTVYEVSELAAGYGKLIGELKISHNELHRLTRTDQLTQVYNRRWFDENFDLEWRRANRNNKKLTLLMIDIDYFKNFNDTYGHVEGDDCLKKVAAVIADSLGRPMDNVVRFGGEEFAVLLPETNIDGGLIIAEKIRGNIEALGIENRRGDTMAVVTVSIGVACVQPSKDMDKEALLDNADKAMYEAKKLGKNRSCEFNS